MTRQFYFILLILASGFLSLTAQAEQSLDSTLKKDGKIRFFAYHLNEFQEVQYLDDKGQWIDAAYDKINTLLRSRGDDDTITMRKDLIELADHLQDHFNVDTIEIISAFRSQTFNKSLKDAGRNVANESFHTKGMAMDVHLDEIREATIRDYLLNLKLGGVGYYGNILMVHMDFGPVRQWQGGEYRENTEIGIFNKASTIKLRTDKLFYSAGDGVAVQSESMTSQSVCKLEKFFRGEWQNQGDVALAADGKIKISELQKLVVSGLPYGKFRLRVEIAADWQNSNEFYIKRL